MSVVDSRKTGVPTPLYDHVYNFKDVYEPAEDTFLFLDALETDIESIKMSKPGLVLEVGSGSGLVTTFIAKIIGKSALYLCTDKNFSASICSEETGRKNDVAILTITTNLVDGLLPRLKNHVDVLLFNPPYVVTSSDEITKGGIAYSWAGGNKGREVIDQFLPVVASLLSPRGVFYLVVIKENNPAEIIETMLSYGLVGSVVIHRRAGSEFLSVLKFKWK